MDRQKFLSQTASAAETSRRNFSLICQNAPIAEFLRELEAAGESIWLENTRRQKELIYHKDTYSMFLRETMRRPIASPDESERFWTFYQPRANHFPKLMRYLLNLAAERSCDLRQITIVKLAPQSDVMPHIDMDPHLKNCARHHMVLASQNGSLLSCEDETVRMWEGEIWWFDNKKTHSARNDSAEWRIHVIFDLHPWSHVREEEGKDAIGFFPKSRASMELELLMRRHLMPLEKNRTVVFDFNTLFLNSEFLDKLSELFWRHYGSSRIQLAILESEASLVLLGALLQKAQNHGIETSAITVSRNEVGGSQLAAGRISGDPIVAICETTGDVGHLARIGLALNDLGHCIDEAFSLVDFSEQRTSEKRISLFRAMDFGGRAAKKPPKQFANVFCFVPKDSKQLNLPAPKSAPAIEDHRLFFGASSGRFHAIDVHDGRELWSFDAALGHIKGILSSPAVNKGTVYFGAYNGDLYALDCQTGERVWTCRDADFIGSSPAIAVDIGSIFVGFEYSHPKFKGALAAVDIATGKLRWSAPVREFLHGSPVYSQRKGLVGVGTNDRTYMMCDAHTGAVSWCIKLDGESKLGATLIDDDRYLLFGSHDGKLRCVETETGRSAWHFQTGDIIYTTPLFVGGRIFVTSCDGSLYIIDAKSCRLLREFVTDGKIYSSPRLIDGKVYFGNNAGFVYEIDPKSCAVTASHLLPDRVVAPIAHSPATGLFYAHTSDDRIFAFRRLAT